MAVAASIRTRFVAGQFVVDRLGAGDVGVSDMAVKTVQVLCEQRGVEFDGHVADGPDTAVVGQAELLRDSHVQGKWHEPFSFLGVRSVKLMEKECEGSVGCREPAVVLEK